MNKEKTAAEHQKTPHEDARLSLAENGFYISFLLNLTKNTVNVLENSTQDIADAYSRMNASEILDRIAGSIQQDGIREEFRFECSRRGLLDKFKRGSRRYKTQFRRINTNQWLECAFILVSNSISGDVETLVSLRDVSHDIRAKAVSDSLARFDYESICIIDVNNRRVIPYRIINMPMNAFDSSNGTISEQDWDRYLDAFCAEEDISSIKKATSLEEVIRKLEEAAVYSVVYSIRRPGKNGVFRVREAYSWLDQEHTEIVCAFQDCTEQYRNEQQQKDRLREALVQAENANEAKTDFLSRMSHDIRTPMNAIIGFTSLAYDELDHPAILKDYLDKISLSSRFLLGLVNDVLDVSKIESGRMELNPSLCHIEDFTNSIHSLIDPLAAAKHITFDMKMNCGLKNIYADPLRFNQIFFNLLSNAVKFTPENGTIVFTAEKLTQTENSENVRFVIRDNGIGMGIEFQKHLFQPFSQENVQFEAGSAGSGLGLVIVKAIVEKMGGTVSVTSRRNEGTVFTVDLPLMMADTIPEPEKNKVQDLAVLRGKRVLLCEDNELNMQIAQMLLNKKGIDVETADNGLKAVSRMAAVPEGYYDAILMDIRMPVMDGLEAAEKIRSLNCGSAKTLPIIAMTANAFNEDVKKCLEAGMDAHVSKPINPDALYNTLAMYMRKK